MEDLASGRLLSATSVRGNDVFPLVDELTGRIRSGLKLTDAPAARSIAEVTSPSLEAYRLYSEGLDTRRNLRYADARKLLQKAVEIDPSFAMAYYELSVIAERIGETAASEDYHLKVLEHLDRLPERQLFLIQASDAQREGDLNKAMDLLEKLIARYPDEEAAYEILAFIYFPELNQPEKAQAILERGTKAVPGSGALRNMLGYRLLWTGRYAEALREFEAYARISPKEPNPYDSLAEAYLITGQPEKAVEKYARALEVDPSFFASHEGRAWAYGMLGRYDEAFAEGIKIKALVAQARIPQTVSHFMWAFMLSRVGRYREAQEDIRQGTQLAEGLKDAVGRVGLQLLSAQLALETTDYPRASEQAGRAQKLIPRIPRQDLRNSWEVLAYLLAGVAEARSGRIEAARANLESQGKLYDPLRTWENWWYHALEGEIALAAGDLPAAEAAFSAGEPELKMWFNNGAPIPSVFANNLRFGDGRARVKKAQGDLAGAIAIYRQLLTPDISNKWTAVLEPRYVLELARLLDQMDDKAEARQQYRRFHELWKNADPGLPELEEARQRLAR